MLGILVIFLLVVALATIPELADALGAVLTYGIGAVIAIVCFALMASFFGSVAVIVWGAVTGPFRRQRV